MDIQRIILLSFSMVLILGIVESFEYDAKELESEEGWQGMYERWRNHHNVQEVSEDEKVARLSVFKTNVQHVHNTNNMNKAYKLKVNKFATMTNHEFRNTYAASNIKHYRKLRGPRKESFMYENVACVPPTVDWRSHNVVTPAKDQANCGACWAFSTVVAVEGINAIKTGELVSLSEQHLIDCDTVLNEGCDGGLMEPAFIFLQLNGGLTTEQNYPYIAQNGTCDPEKVRNQAVTIDGFEDVPERNEDALLKAVANQPVSAAIDANGHDFQFYSSGVFTGKCGTDVNHAVAVVGYGETQEGMKYWIVKNSWGPLWGEDGFVRLQRGVPDPLGLCGIAVEPSYPIKNSNNPINHEL